MTLRIRLADGSEDTYCPYQGCGQCGMALDPNGEAQNPMGETLDVRWDGCPSCGEYTSEFRRFNEQRDVSWPSRALLLRPVEVTHCLDDRNGLEVHKGPQQIAYYPPGAWAWWKIVDQEADS